jgi:hypothetical protein
MKSEIRLSISCLADFVTSASRSPASRLRPYKIKRGEGSVRCSYYQRAVRTVRMYHAAGNDPTVVAKEIIELTALASTATKKQSRTRFERNIMAINGYTKIYGNRQFRVLPNKRLRCEFGNVLATAQADLWVEENGTQVLLKIGVARHGREYIDLLLSLLRKAAVKSGHRIRAKNIVYLNVLTGTEVICSGGLTRFNRLIRTASMEIEKLWPQIT